MNVITKDEAAVLMDNSNGVIFRVNFVKKNGEERQMVCRTGVRRYVTGEGMKYDPRSRGLLPVFDMQIRQGAKSYRMINKDTVTNLKIRGEEYEVK